MTNLKHHSRGNSEEAWAACNVRRQSTVALKQAFADAP